MQQRISDEQLNRHQADLEGPCGDAPDANETHDLVMDLKETRAYIKTVEFANVELSHEVEDYKAQLATLEQANKGMREALDHGCLRCGYVGPSPEASK